MRSLIFIAALVIITLSLTLYSSSPASVNLQSTILTPAQPTTSPASLPPTIPIEITAQAAIVVDASTGAILAAKNPHLRLMPASTTKMMTAYIAIQNYHLDEVVTISRSQDAIGKSTHFFLNEQYTVNDLLKALLINSGNDAALALADHHPFGYSHFVAQMNLQALQWGLKNTHFTNVSGVEEVDHYSSAYDLSLIATHIMNVPQIRAIVGLSHASITTIDGKRTILLRNTNTLLDQIPGLIGIKTGWTDNAGECLVSYVHRDTKDIIIVVLNSTDRFADTKALINWAYQQ